LFKFYSSWLCSENFELNQLQNQNKINEKTVDEVIKDIEQNKTIYNAKCKIGECIYNEILEEYYKTYYFLCLFNGVRI